MRNDHGAKSHSQLFVRLQKYDYCVNRKQHPSSHKGQKGLVLIPLIQSVQPTLISPLFFHLFLFLLPHHSHVSTCRGQYKHSRQAIGFTCHIVLICQEQSRKLLQVIWMQPSLSLPLYFSFCLDLSFSHNCSATGNSACEGTKPSVGAHTHACTHTHQPHEHQYFVW